MNRIITTDGLKTLIYEDTSCKVICNVADFRDPTWWIDIIKIVDKRNNESYPPFKSDKQLEIYQLIALELGNKHGIKEIYTSKFDLIQFDDVKPLEKQLEKPLFY
ncbi:hypothetical protein [Paucisalibacillus globulus]|uniref:hypothetical protein n=1 Tax=Paucisalibacillus globulus TaxID=351095 RepID=UPI0004195F88|nr:hypothetical protein [Paucisalibacillus globulus]